MTETQNPTSAEHLRSLPRFGAEGPSHHAHDESHWDGLRAYELRIQHCRSCSAWIWVAQPLCPHCHRLDPEWESVAPVGVVYAWTRTWTQVVAAATAPYTTVLVELPHAGGRRVLGLYAGEEDPVIGSPVRGDFEPALDESTWPLVRWSAA